MGTTLPLLSCRVFLLFYVEGSLDWNVERVSGWRWCGVWDFKAFCSVVGWFGFNLDREKIRVWFGVISICFASVFGSGFILGIGRWIFVMFPLFQWGVFRRNYSKELITLTLMEILLFHFLSRIQRISFRFFYFYWIKFLFAGLVLHHPPPSPIPTGNLPRWVSIRRDGFHFSSDFQSF